MKREIASKSKPQVTAFPFSTQRICEQRDQQNSENHCWDRKGPSNYHVLWLSKEMKTLGYSNAKSGQHGHEGSHLLLRWSSPGTCASGVPRSGPGTAPACSDCPEWPQPHSCLFRQPSWMTASPPSLLPWPGDSSRLEPAQPGRGAALEWGTPSEG